MKINVIVGDRDQEIECPIEEASFYDVTVSRYPLSPPEISWRVFAAAPDLLKSLHLAQEIIHQHRCTKQKCSEACSEVETVIAQAEGRQP